ncbi:MAG: DUF3298 and DUF4163 domain-containing protein [Anaerolineae bacterium]|nr:DUF3298 and DUF4163 domain-containing protein [Anaerolineae bacterium]
MNKKSLWLVLLLFIALFSVACSLPALPGLRSTETATPTAAPPPTDEPTATPVPPTATPAVVAIPVLGAKTLQDKSESPAYDLDVTYPYMQGDGAQVDPFNQAIEKFINTSVSSFKNDMAQGGDVPVTDSRSSYQVQYTTPLVSGRVVSVLFQTYFYYAGAAHPNSFYTSFNYDLKEHRMLELKDLFMPGSDYLGAISSYSNTVLSSLLGDAFFAEGAQAKEENYKTWNLELDGLLFTFDPYQVGPYAAGAQKVNIPVSALESLTDAESLLKQNQ